MTPIRWTDYSWVDDADAGVDLSVCCLSVITDSTIAEVFEVLPPPRERFEASSIELDERMMKDGMALGLIQHGTAVIMFEPNGFLGNLFKVMGPVSDRRAIASYYYGGHGVSGFSWYADRELVVDFEPAQAVYRHDPDFPPGFADRMDEIGGFWLYDGDPLDPPEPDWDTLHPTEASLALSEAVTGVKLTKELLRDSTYQAAIPGRLVE